MRFLGVELNENKQIWVSLSRIYGIGPSLARTLLKEAKIEETKKTKNLTNQELNLLKEIIEKKGIKVEGELRREIKNNIKRLIDIGCYRGIRHIRHLPVRGQRTKTNSRTVRGNVRKTVGSGRRKPPTPT
ncbi:MAG: 30S ribosomal protein S13 [Minisyncoccia bacterium]